MQENSSDKTRLVTFSLLQYAAFLRCAGAVRHLLGRGADPLWRNSNGTGLLQFLAKRGSVKEICSNTS